MNNSANWALSKENSDYLIRFLTHMKVLGRSENTLILYERSIVKLLQYTSKDAKEMTLEDIEDYQASIVDEVSTATMATHVSAWRVFFDYIEAPNIRINKLRKPTVKSDPPRRLTKIELQRLFDFAITPMENALISIMYYGGLRVSEVTNLERGKDIFKTGEVIIRQGKGGKNDIVLVPEKTIKLIGDYLKVAPKSKYIFSNRRGEKLNPTYLYKIVKKVSLRAGLEGVHPHTLRHTLVYHLKQADMRDSFVQKIARHKNPATTARYGELTKTDILKKMKEIQNRDDVLI